MSVTKGYTLAQRCGALDGSSPEVPWIDYLNPEVYFRPPHLYVSRECDADLYCWIVEPVRGQIFGKAYRVTATEMRKHAGKVSEWLQQRSLEAKAEMIERARIPWFFNMPEGSKWEDFL